MNSSSKKPTTINFITDLYKVLSLNIDGITIIQLNAVYNSIRNKYKTLNDNTTIFVSKELFISEYLFYLEKGQPYLLKKSGFKAWWYRFIGGLFDNIELYQKGLNNLPLSSLSQIKLERNLFEFSNEKKIQLYTYYSEKLDMLIIFNEIKFLYK